MVRRVSLREIGRRVGVSNVAVGAALGLLSEKSRVRISEEKAQEIRRVAQEMGYQPNHLARAFQKQQTQTVGVLFRVLSNPVVVNVMLDAIHRSLAEEGYAASLRPFVGSFDRIEAMARDLVHWRVDGLIFVNVFEIDDPGQRWPGLNAWMDTHGVPFVTVESSVTTSEPGRAFSVDTRDAYARLTDHLLSLGHRRLGALGPAYFFQTPRWEGIVEAARAQGEATVERFLIPQVTDCPPVQEQALGVELAAREITAMKNRPTAILCNNDAAAVSLICGLQDGGLRVPGDVSVAGYDDSEMAMMSRPKLTSVAWPGADMAKAAVKTLVGLIEGEKPEETKRFTGELVVRGSTAPPR